MRYTPGSTTHNSLYLISYKTQSHPYYFNFWSLKHSINIFFFFSSKRWHQIFHSNGNVHTVLFNVRCHLLRSCVLAWLHLSLHSFISCTYPHIVVASLQHVSLCLWPYSTWFNLINSCPWSYSTQFICIHLKNPCFYIVVHQNDFCPLLNISVFFTVTWHVRMTAFCWKVTRILQCILSQSAPTTSWRSEKIRWGTWKRHHVKYATSGPLYYWRMMEKYGWRSVCSISDRINIVLDSSLHVYKDI